MIVIKDVNYIRNTLYRGNHFCRNANYALENGIISVYEKLMLPKLSNSILKNDP